MSAGDVAEYEEQALPEQTAGLKITLVGGNCSPAARFSPGNGAFANYRTSGTFDRCGRLRCLFDTAVFVENETTGEAACHSSMDEDGYYSMLSEHSDDTCSSFYDTDEGERDVEIPDSAKAITVLDASLSPSSGCISENPESPQNEIKKLSQEIRPETSHSVQSFFAPGIGKVAALSTVGDLLASGYWISECGNSELQLSMPRQMRSIEASPPAVRKRETRKLSVESQGDYHTPREGTPCNLLDQIDDIHCDRPDESSAFQKLADRQVLTSIENTVTNQIPKLKSPEIQLDPESITAAHKPPCEEPSLHKCRSQEKRMLNNSKSHDIEWYQTRGSENSSPDSSGSKSSDASDRSKKQRIPNSQKTPDNVPLQTSEKVSRSARVRVGASPAPRGKNHSAPKLPASVESIMNRGGRGADEYSASLPFRNFISRKEATIHADLASALQAAPRFKIPQNPQGAALRFGERGLDFKVRPTDIHNKVWPSGSSSLAKTAAAAAETLKTYQNPSTSELLDIQQASVIRSVTESRASLPLRSSKQIEKTPKTVKICGDGKRRTYSRSQLVDIGRKAASKNGCGKPVILPLDEKTRQKLLVLIKPFNPFDVLNKGFSPLSNKHEYQHMIVSHCL
jgi:hypothetical protein